MPGHWALLTNISNMCTKAEVTGNRDLSSRATHQLIFHGKPRLLLSGLFLLKLSSGESSSTWKNKKPFFSTLLTSYCNRAFEKFPSERLVSKRSALLTLEKKICGGARGGEITNQPLGLQIHIQGNVWKRFLKGLRLSQSLQKQLFFSPGAGEKGEDKRCAGAGWGGKGENARRPENQSELFKVSGAVAGGGGGVAGAQRGKKKFEPRKLPRVQMLGRCQE